MCLVGCFFIWRDLYSSEVIVIDLFFLFLEILGKCCLRWIIGWIILLYRFFFGEVLNIGCFGFGF